MDTQPPTAPSNLSVTASTTTSIGVQWTASSDNVGVTGYRMYLSGVWSWTTLGTTYTYLGLTCGTSYTVAVQAHDAAGNSSPQTSATVATAPCPDTTAPSTPSNLAASSVTGASLTLGWSASTDNLGVTGYDVYRNGTKVQSVTSTSSNQSGLACGTSYVFAVAAYDAAGNHSTQAQLTAATAACPASPPPPPPPPPSGITLAQPDGGANYYSKFSQPLSNSAVPIGVWLACAVDAPSVATDKAAGLNVYVAFCGNANEVQYARNGGMQTLFQDDWFSLGMPTDSVNAGYMIGDEWDMTNSGACAAGSWQSQINRFPNDGRMKYANFGKGVAYWQSDSSAACWVNSVDVPSADVYWYSDNNACGPGEAGGKPGVYTANNCHNAANYGWLANRLRSLVSPARSKPVWAFVENGCPFTGTWPCIRTEQIRGAVWHSLIAGARGIVWFNHSFKSGAGNGGCGSSNNTIRDCPAVRSTVTAINSEVQSLASVVNGQIVTGGFTSTGVKASARWNGSNFYVLAGAVPGSTSGQFSLPCVGNATATVVGENRSIPITAGQFSDVFADGNAIHNYRIDGGSRCGLP